MCERVVISSMFLAIDSAMNSTNYFKRKKNSLFFIARVSGFLQLWEISFETLESIVISIILALLQLASV